MNKKRQLGFAGLLMLELLAAMTVIALLSTQAAVSLVKVLAAQNFSAAKIRVMQVSQAVNAEQICLATPSCVPSPGILNQIPAYGSVLNQNGYVFSMVDGGGGNFSYTAAPFADGLSGVGSIFVDQTGVLRCQPVNQGVANAGSNPCQ